MSSSTFTNMRASPASCDKKVFSTYARYACGTFLSNSPPRMEVQPSDRSLQNRSEPLPADISKQSFLLYLKARARHGYKTPTVQMLLFLFLTFVDALRYTSTNVQNTAAERCTNIRRLHRNRDDRLV